MLRFAAYARVSTGEQTSIPHQLDQLLPLAMRLGGSVVMTETDVLTGLDAKRTGYQRVLEAARRREVDGVLVWKIDRLGRDHVEGIRAARELELLNVKVHSATEPTDDPFVRDLLFLLANRETRVLSERIKMANRARAKQGQWMSRPPAGYRLKTTGEGQDLFKTLEPEPLKASLIRQLFEAAATGKYSARELQTISHALGVTSSTGKELSRTAVHKLLTNPVYQGDVYFARQANGKFEGKHHRAKDDWVIVEDAHPAIVDRDTWARVQEVFAQHKRIQGDPRKTKYLLTSLVYCGKCGFRMYGSYAGKGKKNGLEHFSYQCGRSQSYGSCDTRLVGGQTVDALVKDAMRRFVVTDVVRAQAEAIVREKEAAREQEAVSQRRNLVRQKERVERERLDLARDYMSRGRGVVSPELYASLEAEKVQALSIIEHTLKTLEEVRPLDISRELEALQGIDWDDFDDQAWRETAVLLIERVELQKGAVKGKPVVTIKWAQAAELILQAVSTSPVVP